MAENLDINIRANTTQAIQNLDKLQSKLDKLNTAFGKLKAAAAGIALGGFVAQAFQFADAIQDLSDATNISTNAILGFGKAVQASGGDTEKAQQGLLKFVNTIGEAADGSAKAQQAFGEVGVTLQDLRTLSEQDLLAKTVQGLAKIDDSGKRSVLQMELFGKALRGVSAQGVAGMFETATADSAKYASAIKAAADAQQNFETIISTLKVEVLAALQPISELAAGMLEAGSKAKAFISAVMDIAVVVATFFAVTKAVKLLVYSLELLVAAPALLMRGWQTLTRTWQIFVDQMGRMSKAGEVTAATLQGLKTRFHWVGVAINEIGKGLGVLAAGFVAFYNMIVPDSVHQKLAGFFSDLKNWVSDSSGAGAGRGGNDAITKQLQERGEQLRKESEAAREVKDAYAQKAKEIKQVSDAYARQNAETLDAINFEKSLVGKSENLVEVLRAQEDVYKKAAQESEKLRIAKSLLKDEEQSLAPVYDEQIAKIQKQAEVDAQRIGNAIAGLQALKAQEDYRKFQLEEINKQLERQASLSDQLRAANDKLKDVQFEGQQAQRSPFSRQVEQIREDARKAALEAGRAFSAAFEDSGDGLTPERAKELSDGLDQIAQKYKLIADAQVQNIEASRTFASGWKSAFDEYLDNANNASTRAKDMFQSMTSNMNSAIDRFVETGKFSFGDFARSVIQDLIKIELKAAASKIFSSVFSGAGSFLSGLLGFADGGNPPVNKPSIVGENGPELFVPRTAGTVVPNGQFGAGGAVTNNYITNNISAVDAKSVAQLFAENRKTLLGTVRMAEKEMPYGR